MFKAIILLKRRQDMSLAEFEAWWIGQHAPLARQLPGVRHITFNLAQDGAPFDGVSELWFDSQADFTAAYETDLGKSVAADSMAHVSDRQRLLVTEHTIL